MKFKFEDFDEFIEWTVKLKNKVSDLESENEELKRSLYLENNSKRLYKDKNEKLIEEVTRLKSELDGERKLNIFEVIDRDIKNVLKQK